MNFDDAMVNGPGRSADWRDAINAIRDAMPGKGQASRYLADTYGVSRRQAQRWLAGKGAPDVRSGRRDAVKGDRHAARRRAAQRIRSASVIGAGTVKVAAKSSGQPAGRRNIGVVVVSPAVRQMLNQAAANLEAGNLAQAEVKMGDALLTAYGESKDATGRHVADNLQVSEWPGSVDFS